MFNFGYPFLSFFCLVFGIKSIENVFIINESKPVDKEFLKMEFYVMNEDICHTF